MHAAIFVFRRAHFVVDRRVRGVHASPYTVPRAPFPGLLRRVLPEALLHELLHLLLASAAAGTALPGGLGTYVDAEGTGRNMLEGGATQCP